MEFQLLKFNYPKFLITLFILIIVPLASLFVLDLLELSSKIIKNFVSGISLIGFGTMIFFPKKFTSTITIFITEPLNVVIDDNFKKIKLSSIEKWKYYGPTKLHVSKIKFINSGESYTINIYNNEVYFDFLKTLKRLIREYNEVHDKSIVYLDTEFYNSKLSSYIFKGLFLSNFVFLILLYFDAPAIRFGLALSASFFVTLLYGLQQYVGKLKE